MQPTPELLKVIKAAVFLMFVITAASIFIDYSAKSEKETRQHELEMAQRGYCRKPVLGSTTLTYQPCQVKE